MALILNIDTSSDICSVSIAKDGEEIITLESYEKNAHATIITILISQLFEKSEYKIVNLNAVAVSSGPGSFTGLRIGLSVAKGICYALDIPLISINTLKSMANGISKISCLNSLENNFLICPMIDAKKNEVYAAIYNKNFDEIEPPNVYIVDENFLKEYKNYNIISGGSGVKKLKNLKTSISNFTIIDDFKISAKYMIELSEKKFINKDFENLAYFEPLYIKDFIPTTPKKKIL